MSQMNIQKASDLSIEIDLAPLDSGAEQRTLAHIENCSRQSYTVRMDQTSNTDTITDFHLSHRSLFQTDCRQASKIIRLWTFAGKGFFLLIERYSAADGADNAENDGPSASSRNRGPSTYGTLKALQLSAVDV